MESGDLSQEGKVLFWMSTPMPPFDVCASRNSAELGQKVCLLNLFLLSLANTHASLSIFEWSLFHLQFLHLRIFAQWISLRCVCWDHFWPKAVMMIVDREKQPPRWTDHILVATAGLRWESGRALPPKVLCCDGLSWCQEESTHSAWL